MAPPPNLQELIDVVRQDAASDDPLDQLATASTAAAQLGEVTDALLGHYVDRARRSGHSWTEISGVLGVSKQAVHKRFATPPVPRPLERFTTRARNVLEAATEIARGLGHPYVGTEHLLLAMYAEPESIAGKVLIGGGLTREAVERAVLRRTPRRDETPEAPIPFTPRASAILEATLREALEFGHNYIGTEHMLLALYTDPVVSGDPAAGSRSGGGLAAEVLTELGLDRLTARARIVEALSGYSM